MLKIQLVPRSKHSISVIKTSQSVLSMEIIAVRQGSIQFLDVKPGHT
jgi:hypothetical protein